MGKGAPGFESLRDEPEIVKGGSVTHVHNPSITVFPAPKDKANGAAVIIVPGGGHVNSAHRRRLEPANS